MNKHIRTFKTDVTEVFYYEKDNIPFLIHTDMTKKKGTIFLVNKHENYEILSIKKGEMEIHLDNKKFYAKSGDTVVINPNILHNIIPVTNLVTYHCIITDTEFFKRNGFVTENVNIKELISDKYLTDCCEKIANLVSSEDEKYKVAKSNSLLLNLTIHLFENYSSPKSTQFSKSNTRIIEKAVEYINNHITEQITVESISQHTGYSKFHFCRIFKEITGFTPTTYVNMQKIKFAHTMLSDTDTTVNDVAFKFGFKSTAYFSTTFKKYTGINPGDIKKKCRALQP